MVETSATKVSLNMGPGTVAPEKWGALNYQKTGTSVQMAQSPSDWNLGSGAPDGARDVFATKVSLSKTPERGYSDVPMSQRNVQGKAEY